MSGVITSRKSEQREVGGGGGVDRGELGGGGSKADTI